MRLKKLVLPILCILLLLSVPFAAAFGSVKITAAEISRIIAGAIFKIPVDSDVKWDIIWLLRLPRIVLAACIGAGLSVCGAVMQAIVKNPLADPYILGVSSGASLGATLAIMLGIGTVFGDNFIGVTAAVGAFAASLGVMILANIKGRASSMQLLLSGMALSALCSSFTGFIVFLAHNKDGIQTITYWLMGSLGHASWDSLLVLFPVVCAGIIFFCTQSRILNLMLLGDETAITLGTDLHKYRHLYLMIASLIVGFAVYSSGMIGFIGLVIPHICRMLMGTDHRLLLPAAALAGAVFMIWADVLCRVIINGSELPIGILIALLGAPCFVYLMQKRTYGFGGT